MNFWTESKTKNGERKLSTRISGKWVNVVFYPKNKLYITCDKEVVKNKLNYSEIRDDNQLLWLITEIIRDKTLSNLTFKEMCTKIVNEEKPTLSNKYAEEKAELGKREVEKQNKEVQQKQKTKTKYEKKPEKDPDYFGDGYEDD